MQHISGTFETSVSPTNGIAVVKRLMNSVLISFVLLLESGGHWMLGLMVRDVVVISSKLHHTPRRTLVRCAGGLPTSSVLHLARITARFLQTLPITCISYTCLH